MATSKSQSNGRASAADDVAQQIAALKADVGGLTEALKDLTVERAADVKKSAKDKTDATAEALRTQAAAAGREANRLAERTNEAVQANPATALGIAALVGFAVGFMTSRR